MATKRKEVPTSHEPLYKIMITENYSHRIPDIVQRRVHKAYGIKLSWPWPGPAPFDCLAILAVQLLRDMNIPTALATLVGEYTKPTTDRRDPRDAKTRRDYALRMFGLK